MPLGERIAYLRKVKGMKQKDFAKLLGIHPANAIVVRLVEALTTKQRMEKVLQGTPA